MKLGVTATSALAGALAIAGGVAMPGSAHATLHGFCAGALQCVDNGTNSPTSSDPPVNFGFTTSPGPTTGDLLLDILTPDNVAAGPSFTLSGTLSGTATLFSDDALDFRPAGRLSRHFGKPSQPDRRLSSFHSGPRSRRHRVLRLPSRPRNHNASGPQQPQREPPGKHHFGSPPSSFLHCRLL